MNIETGGPYHPSKQDDQPGATLRDAFAMAALPAVYTSNVNGGNQDQEAIALECYEIADAMIKARVVNPNEEPV